MRRANARILTINGGSSSIKFALFEAGDSLRRILEGAIDRIGLPEAADCRHWGRQVRGISPGPVVMQHDGFTVENVCKQTHKLLRQVGGHEEIAAATKGGT